MIKNRTNVFETIGGLLGGCYAGVTSTLHCTVRLAILLVLWGAASTSAISQVQRVMIARMDYDTTDVALRHETLIDGIALAFDLTKQYSVIPLPVRDSMARRIGDSATYQRVADSLRAEIIVFCSVARLANLIRSEVVIVGGDGFTFSTNGVGYGVTFLQQDSSGAMVHDPAILSSMQRAICAALRDSNLYATAEESLRARPSVLLSVGGIAFGTQPPDYVTWSTFKEKIAASYDAVQTVVASLRFHPEYTVIDVDSRDSMYARAGLYFVENYNTVTLKELSILRAFDIGTIITGRIERVPDGADLTLFLQSIDSKGALTTMKKGTARIPVDSKLALQDGVRACLRQIFGTITEQSESSK
ncbi:MAG: hypothetical protein RL594_401 [Bacteroidota bacterium]|jgi:hypothetical protein